MRFLVIGAGNGGMAMAGHLASMGFPVTLYNRTKERIQRVKEAGSIILTGAITGEFRLRFVTPCLCSALEEADILMVTTVASAHGSLASSMAPFLKPHQMIVLNPGRTGGALEFRRVLSQLGKNNILAEAQTFLYASRWIKDNHTHIYGIKNTVPLATLPGEKGAKVLAVLKRAFPQFTLAETVLHTSLGNIGAVFHPAPLMLNTSKVDYAEDFEHYHQGISPRVAQVMEAVDKERVAISHALGVPAKSARRWLFRSYGAKGHNLYSTIQNNPAYAGIRAPSSLEHRYLLEDVPTGLVPMASLGHWLGVLVPTMEALIILASTLTGIDFWKTGRTTETLGIREFSRETLWHYVQKG